MSHDTLKQTIIKYAEENGSWLWGGQIDDYIRSTTGRKASNASRRCRELVNEGKLERRLARYVGNRKAVQYHIIQVEGQETIMKIPEFVNMSHNIRKIAQLSLRIR